MNYLLTIITLTVSGMLAMLIYAMPDQSADFAKQKKQITEIASKVDGLMDDMDSYIERADKILDKQAENISELHRAKEKIGAWQNKSQAGAFVKGIQQDMCNKILRSLNVK